MYASILAILLDAKRGSVVAPFVCTDCQHARVFLRLAPIETLNSIETLGTTFYSVLRLDRSHTQIAYGRGHPLELLAGFSFPEVLPQGINAAMKRLHKTPAAQRRNRRRASRKRSCPMDDCFAI